MTVWHLPGHLADSMYGTKEGLRVEDEVRKEESGESEEGREGWEMSELTMATAREALMSWCLPGRPDEQQRGRGSSRCQYLCQPEQYQLEDIPSAIFSSSGFFGTILNDDAWYFGHPTASALLR